MIPPSSRFEGKLLKHGYKLIAGVDESGRGPLAGPVVAAAVILPKRIRGLDDCKLLNPFERKNIFDRLKEKAISIGIGIVEHSIIDKINIHRATLLAMQKAVLNLEIQPEYILVDGKFKVALKLPQQAIIAGDRKCFSIAAASIIAKVTRDRIMLRYHQKYPQYGFDKHKGYGTKLHLGNLQRHGPTPIHRKSFEPVENLLN